MPHQKHKHDWTPYMLGSYVCSRCGVNAASVYGSKVYDKGGRFYKPRRV